MSSEETPGAGWFQSLCKARPALSWRHHGWLMGVVIVGYYLDILTKSLALRYLTPGQPHDFLGGWFQVRLLFNPGAAFSMGTGFTIVFAGLGLAALLVLAVLVGPRTKGPMENIVVGLLIAGVGGNVTDRIVRPPAPFHGYVIDFLGIKYFAVFNVADMCITAAAVTIIVVLLRSQAGQKPR